METHLLLKRGIWFFLIPGQSNIKAILFLIFFFFFMMQIKIVKGVMSSFNVVTHTRGYCFRLRVQYFCVSITTTAISTIGG